MSTNSQTEPTKTEQTVHHEKGRLRPQRITVKVSKEPVSSFSGINPSTAELVPCWCHNKGFSIVFRDHLLAKVESSQKSIGMWFFRHSFAPYLFHHGRNNRLGRLRSKFWRKKCSENQI